MPYIPSWNTRENTEDVDDENSWRGPSQKEKEGLTETKEQIASIVKNVIAALGYKKEEPITITPSPVVETPTPVAEVVPPTENRNQGQQPKKEEALTHNPLGPRVCKQFMNTGNCNYGAKCSLAHPATRNVPCQNMVHFGTCSLGRQCPFKHEKKTVKSVPKVPESKTTGNELVRTEPIPNDKQKIVEIYSESGQEGWGFLITANNGLRRLVFNKHFTLGRAKLNVKTLGTDENHPASEMELDTERCVLHPTIDLAYVELTSSELKTVSTSTMAVCPDKVEAAHMFIKRNGQFHMTFSQKCLGKDADGDYILFNTSAPGDCGSKVMSGNTFIGYHRAGRGDNNGNCFVPFTPELIQFLKN